MGVLNSLKNKMQHLRDELEKYKDLYDEKCVELEEEKQKRSEVRVKLWFNFSCHFVARWSVSILHDWKKIEGVSDQATSFETKKIEQINEMDSLLRLMELFWNTKSL